MVFEKEKLIETLKNLPIILEAYFNNIPEEYLDRKRSETSWTIREHLYHIVFVQEMLYSRMLKIKDEENPVITPFFPENKSEALKCCESIQSAFSSYRSLKDKQILLINQLTDSEFNKEAKHGEFIRYNIPIIIHHMVFHEYWHIHRIEELWLTRDEYFV